MAIETTYKEFIFEKIIKEILAEGTVPTLTEIETRYNDFIEANDVSNSLFNLNESKVETKEISSASKFNNTLDSIYQDLYILYRHLFKISDQSLRYFQRWKAESEILEHRLDELNERINLLTLVNLDSAGYFNFIQENFLNSSKIDLTNTKAFIDYNQSFVSIGTSTNNSTPTKIDLSSLTNKNIEVNVLSRNNLLSIIESNGSQKKNIVSNSSESFQQTIWLSKADPVSIEVKIDLLEEYDFTRLDIDLHMSNSTSSIQITPMYSLDNFNFNQLPIETFTRSIIDKSSFIFSKITARYIKLVMTKLGFDRFIKEQFGYEFGIDELSIYNETFTTNTETIFLSQALSVLDKDGTPLEFNKVVLEVCEEIPENTSIDYYVAASVDTDFSNNEFVRIEPITRQETLNPTIINFGDLSEIEVSDIGISYNAAGTTNFINPKQTYTLISSIVEGTITSSTITASNIRYGFLNSNDRILDYELSQSIDISKKGIEIWRNISSRTSSAEIRGTKNGWRYEDPYYITNVYVKNSNGFKINIGNNPMIIDDTPQRETFTLSPGKHTIKVYKNNWQTINLTTVSTLSELKSADSLYPFNHKYLVEGINYSTSYNSVDPKIYLGFDIVAEYLMTEVSVLDLLNNVSSNDYSKFAIDLSSVDGAVGPNKVFLLKVDENQSDFINEKFLIRFNSVNQLYSYLKFKAVLNTEDETLTPFLQSYRLKISH